MKLKDRLRPIWLDQEHSIVHVIDQRMLPHRQVVAELKTVDDVITAIQDMYVRGAPLIGVTGAYGAYLVVQDGIIKKLPDDEIIRNLNRLKAARPTAVNLAWAVDQVLDIIVDAGISSSQKIQAALDAAKRIEEREVDHCKRIGLHGVELIKNISEKKSGKPVNILTHCNAGWLACIEYGTATAPIYAAMDADIPVHVWVDETRPLNQGARLTAWELGRYGVSHSVITDNAGGHLMQHGKVDIVIVGTDRTTRTGDVANKIGTYLKALAAKDNDVPFYVALPSSTFDWNLTDGLNDIPIEERNPDEVRYVEGNDDGTLRRVMIMPKESRAVNYAFDVTPARLITGLITERGICRANEIDILRLFPEFNKIS